MKVLFLAVLFRELCTRHRELQLSKNVIEEGMERTDWLSTEHMNAETGMISVLMKAA